MQIEEACISLYLHVSLTVCLQYIRSLITLFWNLVLISFPFLELDRVLDNLI